MMSVNAQESRYRLVLLVGLILLLISTLSFGFASKVSANVADHVVISEVQIDSTPGSGGASDDFVELYNPTDMAMDLSAWSVQKTTGTGTSLAKVNLSGIIPAHGYYLVVRGGAAQNLLDLADDIGPTSFSIAANNVVYLVSNQDAIEDVNDPDIVDLVGLGDAAIFKGSATAINPAEGGSVERMSGNPHEDGMGNGWDTNDNMADFMQAETSNPQNSLSPAEPEIIEEPGDEPGDQPQNEPEDNPEDQPQDEPQTPSEDLDFFQMIFSRILSRFENHNFPSFPSFGESIRDRLYGNEPPEIPIPTI